MKYKVSKKIFGTNTVEPITDLYTPLPISDVCWAGDLGLAYAAGNIIGAFSSEQGNIYPWKGETTGLPRIGSNPRFETLGGLSYLQRQKFLFAGEAGGRSIRMIDIPNDYSSSVIEGQPKASVSVLLKKTPIDVAAHIAPVGRDRVFIALPSIKKVFYYCDSALHHVAGDGRCRFSSGVRPQDTSIGCPSGVAIRDRKLLLADSLSGVIRELDGTHMKILCGHPCENILPSPSKMAVQKDVLYIMCQDGVRTYSFATESNSDSPVYESNSIVGIAADFDNSLYIVEKEDA
jgi:hypothetical protein